MIAVVGTGYWGKNLARNFHALGVLKAVYDSVRVTAEAIAGRHPGVGVYSSIDEVLADPEINAVAIATPAGTHAAMVRRALVAGKDVYVEKPLCLTVEEGQALIALAAAKGLILMVGHLLWYHPVVLRLKELVAGGELGRLQAIYSNRLNLGKLRREENVLWSFAPHDVSVILGLLGELPESVRAQAGYFLDQRTADMTVSLLDFASGVRAHIFVSWLHPFKEQKLVVVGDRQMAVFDDTADWSEKLTLYPHSIEWRDNLPTVQKAEGSHVVVPEAEPLFAECAHFLECVEQRITPRTDGEEGLRVLRVLRACQDAIESKFAVVLDPVANPYFRHPTAEIEPGSSIGTGSKIWHFSHILAGSQIGTECVIGQNVMIGPDVSVGNGCKIQNNVSIYKGVVLESDVFCGPSMVFTNVGNPRAQVNRKSEFRQTLVRRGATIGANATIVCGTTLGEYCFVGAGAVVTKSVASYALVVGNPAVQIGWACACGERLPKELSCSACGREYVDADGVLHQCP